MGQSNINLAALIGSRICHDLISPIGAINNGLELLGMSDAREGPELELISESVGNASARIRFFRWVDMEERRPRTRSETRAIIDAMQGRDTERAVRLMESHISRRSDEIAEALKECYAKLFLDGDFVEPRFVEKVDV